LKHFLYEINEVLEGRGEKIVSQTRELVRDTEPTPKEALGMFGQLNHLLNKGRERAEVLEGKKWNDKLVNEERINGNPDRGKEILKQICQEVAPRHGDFDLYSEQKKVRGVSDTTQPTEYNRQGLIEDIKNHIHEFELEEVLVFNGHFWNGTNWVKYDNEKREVMLIHKSVIELEKKYNQFGALEVHHGKMFDKQIIGEQGWVEIERAKLRSEQKRTSYHQTSSPKDNRPQGGSGGNKGGGFGGYGSSIIFSSVSVVSLIGLSFVK